MAGRDAHPLQPPAQARPVVGFLFIGGAHQMLHAAPVAAELLRTGACAVRLIAGTAEDRDRLAALMRRLGAASPPVETLPRLGLAGRIKQLPVIAGRRLFRELDALVTTERTSTVLKLLPGRAPVIVHIPHGAGDRARGFEGRIRLCDQLVVAGPKDRDRMVADGLAATARCSASGYVKLAAALALARAEAAAPLPLDPRRPTLLYSPHFDPRLGSWRRFGEAWARAAATMTGRNFILAPHVRLAERITAAERAAIARLAEPGRVLVDWGSDRSNDMSYTIAADLYLGDVSSQVYEFLHLPRPCVFLNATGTDRTGDRDFAHWRYGEVVDDPAELPRALADAPGRHPAFVEAQRAGAAAALGPWEGAAARAAGIVAEVAREVRRARG